MASVPLPHYLRPPLPTVFVLELTQRCQNDCVGCGNVFTHGKAELDLPAWGEILERLSPHIQALRISGGEPTLHPAFEKLVARIEALGVPWVLFTNGNWATPSQVISRLVDCRHLQGLLVSLHGHTPESYARFCGVEAFECVTANIRRAAQAGLRITTNTLLLSTTLAHLADIATLAYSLGAAAVAFGRYYGLPHPGLTLSPGELRQGLSAVAGLRKEDRRITLSNCVPACFLPGVDFGGQGCTSGLTHCTIGPLGEIRPCTHAPMVLGNALCDDLATVWQSAALESWRQAIPAGCRTCAALNRCRGGCRATATQWGLPADPLVTAPLTQAADPPTVALRLQDRPRLACTVSETDYGLALSSLGRYVTLSPRSKAILRDLDGETSVAQLLERHGPAAVELAASLLHLQLLQIALPG